SNNPDQSSALYVFRSTGNFGASWNFPARPVAERNDVIGTGATLLDKPLMTVDNTRGSQFQDRVYVTWTDFASDGSAYIFEAHSSDYGEHFSAPVVVSNDSALCRNTFGVATPHGNCNENQYSQPFTGSDGALYVVWSNFNNVVTGSDNRNQILLAKSTDGGVSFGAPILVAEYYDLPDCATYQGQDFGRACVPEKGASANSFFRASNYPSGAVDPTNPNRIVVAFGSYINPSSKEANGCVPSGFSPFGQNSYTGVKTVGACNNDILVSISSDGGTSFTGTTTDPRLLTSATSTPAQATSDQWFQWLAFTKGGQVAISYYDRQYGDDETTGFSDVSVSGSGDFIHFGAKRVTSSSMPPPTQFSGVFWGDYTGLTAMDTTHPIWSDTRSPELFLCPGTGTTGVPPTVCTSSASNASFANDQDVYMDSVPVPSH
ncbi:MAG: exo-alpha-sialidase, partial [Betaproteobacteria bacterium]